MLVLRLGSLNHGGAHNLIFTNSAPLPLVIASNTVLLRLIRRANSNHDAKARKTGQYIRLEGSSGSENVFCRL